MEGGRGGPPPPRGLLGTLSGRRILLVVTGGVAAYKTVYLARLLVKAGASVRTALTEAGARFVTPLTFEAATGGEAAASMWERRRTEIGHVAWAEWAELAIVAPATADFCARLACGLAGDFPSALLLATAAPVVVCPAMNTGMLLNPATAANLATLEGRGVTVLGSPSGPLACGSTGEGRMAEPPDVAAAAARALAPGWLAGRRVIVTSGATAEPWDDIRYLTNRSSGRMGAELARAAWLLGAEVELISGPYAEEAGVNAPGLAQTRVGDCRELLAALESRIGEAQVLVMNAAPADFRPAERVTGKIGKAGGIPRLELARNPDILATLAPRKPAGSVWIGFAAESGDLEAGARAKLAAKALDYIAANSASGPGSAFGGGLTELTVLDPSGRVTLRTPRVAKFEAAWLLLESVFGGAG
ncbi:MAG: bifunctional phosphopantothenoylcysteine decarboxylase/phosphopantothenate--cysteine ligase CoaBC [Deltaproteobacteria bacterium]|jgi:phosphopantothenoylcysteine decarboxylase/phosphopantothenate--cysteine ligase|nr:bifunctional phosphopantothenoylcysteine decarboxylase/phosphopantothenate--cysteine ligase CoaBC [Deltaproteobacteria bacterium]